MNLVPLNDKVIVEQVQAPSKTPGGILIPEGSKEAPAKGKVLSVGKGKYDNGNRVKVDVAPGELVWYGRYSGSKIEHDGKVYLVLSEADILAVER